MKGYLLDTNCISELVRPRTERRVIRWVDAADEATLYLSVIRLGEIRKGVTTLPLGKRRVALESWLEMALPARFAGRILAIDAAVVDCWGILTAQGEARGRNLPAIDALLAATALAHNLVIVSRNVADFPFCQVLNLGSRRASRQPALYDRAQMRFRWTTCLRRCPRREFRAAGR